MTATASNSATHDATLTTTYTVPLTGLTVGGQSRLMTAGEITAFPADVGFRPAIQRQSGLGWICTVGGFGGTGIIDSSSTFPRFPQRVARLSTTGTVIEVSLFAQSNGSYEVLVDGVKTDLAGATNALLGISYLKVSASDLAGRVVEIRTDCYIGQVATNAGQTVSKPTAKTGQRILVFGESVTQPVIWDGVTGLGSLPGLACWQRMVTDLWPSVADMQIEGIGGTSFYTRQAGSYNSGINNYLDRVTGHISYAPDILIVSTAWSDDFQAGATQTQSVGNADLYVQAVQAALPSCKIVFIEGLRAPAESSDPTSTYTAWTEAMRALHSDLYWIRPSGWYQIAGYTPGHTTGGGNTDEYTGSDALHPTVEGHNRYRENYKPLVQAIAADSGALRNTILTQQVS